MPAGRRGCWGPKAGALPAVSWVVPSGEVSEHPPAPVSFGQSYVTSLVNAVMQSPDWSSTATFLAWDDWGGFYDHVAPPSVDQNGGRLLSVLSNESAQVSSSRA